MAKFPSLRLQKHVVEVEMEWVAYCDDRISATACYDVQRKGMAVGNWSANAVERRMGGNFLVRVNNNPSERLTAEMAYRLMWTEDVHQGFQETAERWEGISFVVLPSAKHSKIDSEWN